VLLNFAEGELYLYLLLHFETNAVPRYHPVPLLSCTTHQWGQSVKDNSSFSLRSKSQSMSRYDRRSVIPSWCRAPVQILFSQTVAVLSMWGALSDERAGLVICPSHNRQYKSMCFSSPSLVKLPCVIYVHTIYSFIRTVHGIILSRVRGSVTNNNGFWTGSLDLLTFLLQ
jgi:hypothetical protein